MQCRPDIRCNTSYLSPVFLVTIPALLDGAAYLLLAQLLSILAALLLQLQRHDFGHVPVRRRHPRLDQCLLQLRGHLVARREPVVVRLELGGHHHLAEAGGAAQPVQVQVAHLRPEIVRLG